MDKLMLNDEKTEFIVIGTRQQLVKVVIDSLCVCHTAILPSSEVRNLAGWFANQLKIVTQINQTCKAAFFHIFNPFTQPAYHYRLSAIDDVKSVSGINKGIRNLTNKVLS